MDILAAFMRDTPLLAAGTPEDPGVMTIGWGGLGSLWKQPVCTVYVRPQRNTFGHMERSGYFSVNFFDRRYAPQLLYCGTHSGRDGDKLKACGLTPARTPEGAPCLEEADLVLVCRKLYRQQLDPACFTDEAAREAYFKTDFHYMYIGRVEAVYQSEQEKTGTTGRKE